MTAELSNLLNDKLYNTIDSSFFLYLTPEFNENYSIYTVEKAYEYYQNYNIPYPTSNLPTVSRVIPERNVFLENFDYNVYFHFYQSNILHDNFIDDAVRASISNDIERLSIIHYHRVGNGLHNFNKTSIDSNFNPYLYKVAHNITREMTNAETYYDYLNRLSDGSENIIIGNVNDLGMYINCNLTISVDNLTVDDTLIVKENAVIHKNAVINGNVVTDGQGIAVNGGTIMIDNNYGNVSRMFEQGRLSSNSLKFENSEIKLIKGNGVTSDMLYVSGADFNVESNLHVKQISRFDSNILIGNALIVDDNYSLQTEKKIRVEGTDIMSDKRLKKNIDIIDTKDCLDKIMKIDLKKYNMISDKFKSVGVLAQEVKNVLPDIVNSSIGYIPLFVEFLAFNEQCFEIKGDLNNELSKNDRLRIKDTVTDKVFYCTVNSIDSNKYVHLDEDVLMPYRLYSVSKEVEDLLSVDYTQLFTYLIGAVQEIQSNFIERT